MPFELKTVSVAVPSLHPASVELSATVRYSWPGPRQDKTVLVCWPGGSYGQPYWDFPAEGYSFSRYMAERGHVIVNVDPLGVGGSTRPADGDDIGLAVMAEAAAGFTHRLRMMLESGTLASGLAPVEGAHLVGVGHSMGAALVTAQQALFSSYEAVAILGFAVRFRDLSADGDTRSMSVAELVRSPAAAHVRSGSAETWDDKYVALDRAVMRNAFHLPDVSAEIADADDALAVSWPRRPIIEAAAGFGSLYAAKVAVPVFLGLGAFDLAADPRAEVQSYPKCDDITLKVLQNSAHCHNFSTDRELLWERMNEWLEGGPGR